MDIQSIIIGIIVIGLCFLPYVYFTKKNKKKDAQFFKVLSDKAKQLNCSLTQHEASGNIVLGLDDANLLLFFLKKLRGGDERLQHVDLTEVKAVRINNISRTVGEKDSKKKVIDKLQLVFSNYDYSKRDVTFEFYNSDETLVMNGELQLIERWLQIVNEKINPKPLNKPLVKVLV